MEKWRGPESPPETARRSDATDEPVAKVVKTGEPSPKRRGINDLLDRPVSRLELQMPRRAPRASELSSVVCERWTETQRTAEVRRARIGSAFSSPVTSSTMMRSSSPSNLSRNTK
jgi:hypothetical protein